MTSVRLRILCLLAFVSACSRSEPHPPALPVLTAQPDPAVARLPLAQRLAREARARPARGVHAEALRAQLDQHGVSLLRTRQVLAEPLGARFCEVSSSDRGLSVAVCEFSDRQAAARGLTRSRALFDRLMPGRTLLVNENALLTLAAGDDDERALTARLFRDLLETQRI